MTTEHATHPDDDLVDLATGLPVPDAVTTHVADCRRCADEVAALRSLVDLAREPVPDLVPAQPAVWAAVTARLDDPDCVLEPGAPAGLRLTAVPRTRRRVSAWWVAAAAAAGLVVGGAGVGLLTRSDPAVAPVVVARADLDALDTARALGKASAVRVDGHLDLDLQTSRIDPGTGYLEVWLINRDLTRMVSVGVLRPGEDEQRFAIDQALLDEGYVIVDISREGYDGRPEHSGDSIARGTLAL